MNYYKIKSILHSGRKGERNTSRTDGKYPIRINRIVKFDEKDIIIGQPFYLDYILDENGNDYRRFVLRTSKVVNWDYVFDNRICIETNNSIYELEEVDEDEVNI